MKTKYIYCEKCNKILIECESESEFLFYNSIGILCKKCLQELLFKK
jgi:RNase P subunit RPR2